MFLLKVVILAGGFGTRISEESHLRPKPMVEIGGKPIIWHIMKLYSSYGFNDFIICLGYKGYYIKEYFEHYFLHESDITFDFKSNNRKIIHNHSAEPWTVTLVSTGLETMTGGRIKKIQKYIDGKPFLATYGDGVSNINIKKLVAYHLEHGKIATMTSVQPAGRFGAINVSENNEVINFHEKPRGDGNWVNAGFFVFQPEIFDYLEDENTVLEKEPLQQLASKRQLRTFKHEGFWKPMDTLRDKKELEDLWSLEIPPWKVW